MKTNNKYIDGWDRFYATLDSLIELLRLARRVVWWSLSGLLRVFAVLLIILLGMLALWFHPVFTIVVIAILIICL